MSSSSTIVFNCGPARRSNSFLFCAPYPDSRDRQIMFKVPFIVLKREPFSIRCFFWTLPVIFHLTFVSARQFYLDNLQEEGGGRLLIVYWQAVGDKSHRECVRIFQALDSCKPKLCMELFCAGRSQNVGCILKDSMQFLHLLILKHSQSICLGIRSFYSLPWSGVTASILWAI